MKPARRMARENLKQRSLSRRRFMQSAAAMAVSGTMLATAARADRGHDSRRHDSRGPDSECEGSRDLNLVNGRFLTMDARDSVVWGLAVRDGRIVEVGRAGALGPCSRTINLKGATVIPGLIDSHVHYIRCGLNPGHEVRIIETATSVADLQHMISTRIATLPVPANDFVTCIGGWNRNGLAEKRLPTPAELDTAAPRNPVYLSETGGGGAAVTNTSGIAFFQSRGVAVNATTGVLIAGQGQAALTALQTDASKQQGTAEAMDFAASLGITMFHDHGGLSGLDPYQYALNLWRQDALKVRVRPWLWSGDDSGVSVAETRIVNNFNSVGDDVWRQLGVGERINTSTTNPLNSDAWKFAAQHGWMVTQHSLTAAEIAFHIAAYQAAAEVGPIGALRWSLCHVNPITDAQIQAVKELGIALNIQGTSYTSAGGAAPSGPPFRRLLDAGIPCGGGSDATNVAAFNPWLMMYYMTTAKNNAGVVINGDQAITRLEALKMYTKGSAYLSWDDDELGSIESGKLADLVVLSDDPLSVSDDKFRKVRSVLTLQAGRIVHGATD
jgi:predicted amidohydrolase YtcJ